MDQGRDGEEWGRDQFCVEARKGFVLAMAAPVISYPSSWPHSTFPDSLGHRSKWTYLGSRDLHPGKGTKVPLLRGDCPPVAISMAGWRGGGLGRIGLLVTATQNMFLGSKLPEHSRTSK